MTAKETLEQLKQTILKSMAEAEEIILYGIKEKKYDEVAKLQHVIWGRSDVVYWIDEILEQIEKSDKV